MNIQLPQRPALSSAAHIQKISEKITLISNLFPIKFEQISSSDNIKNTQTTSTEFNVICCQYQIEIEPQVGYGNKSLRYRILNAAKPKIEAIFGKNSYSHHSLFTLNQPRCGEGKKIKSFAIDQISVDEVFYTVRINLIGEDNIAEDDTKCEGYFNPKGGYKVTLVIKTVLNQITRDLKYEEIWKNQKFFDLRSITEVPVADRGGKKSVLLVCKGFQLGTTLTASKMYIMFDYASLILRKETALEFLSQFKKEQQEQHIVGHCVMTEYNKFQIYKICSIDFTRNPNTMFYWKEKKQQISFVNYYKQRYGIVVKNLEQPLLVHRPRGSTIEQVYLVPEICTMMHMSDEQKSNFKTMKAIAVHNKLTPDQRFIESVRAADLFTKAYHRLGVKIDTTASQVEARILNPPKLSFGKGKHLVPEKGNFDMSQEICDPITLQKEEWALIYHQRDRGKADMMLQSFRNVGKHYGIFFEDPIFFEVDSENVEDWTNMLEKDFLQNDLPNLVVSLADMNLRGVYQGLKKFLYNNVGLNHQNVRPRSFEKNMMSVASKITLQIAAKLDKRLWTTEIPAGLNTRTMLIGIENSSRSIIDRNQIMQVIGVVATVSNDLTKFYSEVDLRKDENSSSTLASIIKKSLEIYKRNTGSVPEEIIIYRQKPVEGKIALSFFDKIRYYNEIKAFEEGCSSFCQDYTPRFAFFQVKKKNGQKFYQRGKEGLHNPISGSIIADQVVGTSFEFFLCAQNVFSGVCTPTQYTCIHNNTMLTEDTIWQLTYFQCYNYYNWQGPVRVPAPLMYAGKLAKFTSDVLRQKAHDYLVNSVYYL